MTRCPSSRKKRRTQRGRGKSSGYKRGMKGHSWEKLIKDDEHIGRRCTKCGKIVLNARGIINENDYKDRK